MVGLLFNLGGIFSKMRSLLVPNPAEVPQAPKQSKYDEPEYSVSSTFHHHQLERSMNCCHFANLVMAKDMSANTTRVHSTLYVLRPQIVRRHPSIRSGVIVCRLDSKFCRFWRSFTMSYELLIKTLIVAIRAIEACA